MKKLFLSLISLLVVTALGAQSLEDIVKKYGEANKLDKISSLKTVKMSYSMNMMGMELPTQVWMKNPDKLKTVTDFNGQQMIQAYDGTKGYSINPMAGSTEPVEMGPDEISQAKRNNLFNNQLDSYLKEGKLTLEGEEAINGNPAHKIKVTLENGMFMMMFIDKASSLLTKMSITVNNQGMDMIVDTYPSDYKEINGVFLATKTTISAMGQEFTQTVTNVEVDIPMDDSIFTLK